MTVKTKKANRPKARQRRDRVVELPAQAKTGLESTTGPMAFEAIMAEVDQLNLADDRIEGLAGHHLPVSEALISIAGNVRAPQLYLAVLVETKLRNGDGNGFSRSKKPI